MGNVIRAIVLAAIAQVCLLGVLVSWLFIHTDNMNQTYARLAENNANSYSNEVARKQYNRWLLEQSREREQLHDWTERQISFRINQALKEPSK